MSGARTRTLLIVLALVAVVAVAAVVLLRGSTPRAPSGSAPTPVAGRAAPRLLQGQVQAPARLVLKAPAAGRVVALGASEGKAVVTGQLIAQIDSASARQRLAEARARLQRVERQVATARTGEIAEKLRQAQLRLDAALQSRETARSKLRAFRTEHPQLVELSLAARDTAGKVREKQAALRRTNERLAAAQKGGKAPDDPLVAQLRAEADRCYLEATAASQRMDLIRQSATRSREQLAALARLEGAAARADKLALSYGARLTALRETPEGQARLKGTRLVEAAQRAQSAAEALVTSCALTAGVGGRLAELRVRPGEAVTAGQTIAVVEHGGGDRLVCRAAAADLPGLAVGRRAQVRPSVGPPFEAAISQLIPSSGGALVYLAPLGKAPLPARGTTVVAELAASRRPR